VSAVTVVNSTTITATFGISTTATLSTRDVRVTSLGVQSAVNAPADQFTVVAAPTPTVTGVSPNSGVRGTNVSVTISGTNFANGATVTAGGGGVTVSAVTVVNSTTITATFGISATATLSTRDVRVTSLGVQSPVNAPADHFTVGATLTAISPTSGTHNTTVGVTLTGTNLSGATAVTMSGTGITCSGITSTATSVGASCMIANGAALTTRSVTVATPQGNATLTGAFTVN
jgi:hypothetical protein